MVVACKNMEISQPQNKLGRKVSRRSTCYRYVLMIGEECQEMYSSREDRRYEPRMCGLGEFVFGCFTVHDWSLARYC